MKWKLPELKGWIDCAPYEGMQMECWLNPTTEDEPYAPPKTDRQPWHHELWYMYGRIFLRLKVPAELAGADEDEIIELGSARAVYDLTKTPGFDQSILQHAMGEWGNRRHALMLEAEKN